VKVSISTFLGLLLLGNTAFAQTAPAPVAAAGRIVLVVDEIKTIRSFPVVVAERLGYFKDAGIDVSVVNIRNEIPTVDMLMDGRADAVMAYYHHNVVNHAEGHATEAVVTLGVTPGVKVMVANGAKEKYKTLAQLKGSRFITGGAGSAKTTVANYLVLAGGNKLDDYTRLATDSQDKNVVALREGTADFLVAPTPEGSFYEAQGVASVFADLTTVDGTRKAFGVLFPSNTVYMSSERVKAHPEIAQHLANAFARALKYINSHSAEEIAALIPPEISGKDRAAYLAILKEEIPMYANDGRMPEDAAEKEWRVLAQFNPKYKNVDVKQTYTNRFVDEALKKIH
jgi:NitT/TauT family transport system substrate-binding protein